MDGLEELLEEHLLYPVHHLWLRFNRYNRPAIYKSIFSMKVLKVILLFKLVQKLWIQLLL